VFILLAVVKNRPEPGLETADLPDPVMRDNEVIVDIKASGICGTDLAIEKWMDWTADIIGDNLPVVVGHEFGGDVIETGKNVRNFKKGDRVVVEPFITCGNCYFCSIGRPNLCLERYYLGMHVNGGMAEYAAVPESVLYKLPGGIPYHFIPLLETLATCVHPVERLNINPGDTVAVIGPGPIGLCILQVVKAAGAAKVIVIGTEKSRSRLHVAKELGADLTIEKGKEDIIEGALSFTSGLGVDVAIDSTGTEEGIMAALNMVRRGGEVCLVGVSDDPVAIKPFSQLMTREVNLISSLARIPSSWHRAIRLVETGRINLDILIGKRLPLKDALKGFEMVRNREAVKIVLEP
jgi:2-desacetyl-2-hydroxyethyl bacteriochlorophyllide A dehydrogenase